MEPTVEIDGGDGATQAPGDPEQWHSSLAPTEETSGGDGDVEGEMEGEEEEEEEAECGFCLFMKGGDCKEPFIAWEKCVEEAEKSGEDVVDKCFEVTSLLKKCMDAHADYYAPILQAEQAMVDAATAAIAESEPEPETEKVAPESKPEAQD